MAHVEKLPFAVAITLPSGFTETFIVAVDPEEFEEYSSMIKRQERSDKRDCEAQFKILMELIPLNFLAGFRCLT